MTTKQTRTLVHDTRAPGLCDRHPVAELIQLQPINISEAAALVLLKAVLTVEEGQQPLTREYILDAYAECNEAIVGNRPLRPAIATLN